MLEYVTGACFTLVRICFISTHSFQQATILLKPNVPFLYGPQLEPPELQHNESWVPPINHKQLSHVKGQVETHNETATPNQKVILSEGTNQNPQCIIKPSKIGESREGPPFSHGFASCMALHCHSSQIHWCQCHWWRIFLDYLWYIWRQHCLRCIGRFDWHLSGSSQ